MYILSAGEKQRICFQLTNILVEVPVGAVDEVMALVQKNIAIRKESSDKNARRYSYVETLLTTATSLLEKGKQNEVVLYWLTEGNHGNSGWIDTVRYIYYGPRNDEEQALSNRLWELHIKTIEKLLESTKPTVGIIDFMDVQIIASFIYRLGENVPKHLIVGIKQLLVDCEKIAKSSDQHVFELADKIRRSFPT